MDTAALYAYGEALLAAGRRDDAVRAFLDAAQTDADGETDAEERAALVAAGIDTPPGELTDDDLAEVDEAAAADEAVAADGTDGTTPPDAEAVEDPVP